MLIKNNIHRSWFNYTEYFKKYPPHQDTSSEDSNSNSSESDSDSDSDTCFHRPPKRYWSSDTLVSETSGVIVSTEVEQSEIVNEVKEVLESLLQQACNQHVEAGDSENRANETSIPHMPCVDSEDQTGI